MEVTPSAAEAIDDTAVSAKKAEKEAKRKRKSEAAEGDDAAPAEDGEKVCTRNPLFSCSAAGAPVFFTEEEEEEESRGRGGRGKLGIHSLFVSHLTQARPSQTPKKEKKKSKKSESKDTA